ncbi:glycosyltransferase family protein [Hymenobacter jejuensis]|nr:glycosyltransferase family 39 protein [Hymenobacter jejuensis]
MKSEAHDLSTLAEKRTKVKIATGLLKNISWEYTLPALAIFSLLISCIIISTKKHYWNDELFSYYMTSEPSFAKMLAAFHDKLNNTPILYFFLGWNWDKLFGSSEISLRLFSSLGICAALLVTWISLRKIYGFCPTSIGVFLIFCTSQIILTQNAEARMYGLFLILNALAFLLYTNFYKDQSPSTLLLILNSVIHAAIIHTHLFGGFYSGAILFSLLISDRIFKLFRPKLYLSIILSWSSLILYIPTFLIQADAGKPRTYIFEPNFLDLADVYNLTAPSFIRRPILLVFLFVMAYLFCLHIYRRSAKFRISKTEIPSLVLGIVFFIIPFFIWIISLTIKPIFLDRYLIPSALGWTIIVTFISAKMSSVLSSNIPENKNLKFRNTILRIFAYILIFSLITIIIAYPISEAIKYEQERIPGSSDMTSDILQKYSNLPRVVTYSHSFLERIYYSSERNKFFYILDWKSATDKYSGSFGPQEYKHMEAWKRNFPNIFKNVVKSDDFLKHHDRFLVLDTHNYLCKCPPNHKGLRNVDVDFYLDCPQWVETRLLNNRLYKVTFLNNKNWFSVLLVEKHNSNSSQAPLK